MLKSIKKGYTIMVTILLLEWRDSNPNKKGNIRDYAATSIRWFTYYSKNHKLYCLIRKANQLSLLKSY